MQWEYRIETVNMNEKWSSKKQAIELASLNERLNNLGFDGWEMISYESVPLTGTFSGNIKGYAYMMFFKRNANNGYTSSNKI